MNIKPGSRFLTIACVWLLAISTATQAQQYPNRPVTIISDSAAGSTPDAVLRVIADRLSQIWRQQVLAVNHPGATGSIASRSILRSASPGSPISLHGQRCVRAKYLAR